LAQGREAARRAFFEELAPIKATLILFEGGSRLAASLSDMAAVFGPRPAAVTRELTKLYETAVRGPLEKAGKLGPSLRLMPTTAATTLRKSDPPLVIDGPFAETKEQLLGFYIVDVADLDEALGIAAELAAVNPGGAYEIRPLAVFNAGAAVG